MSANTKVRIEGSKNLMDAALKHNVRKSLLKVLHLRMNLGKV